MSTHFKKLNRFFYLKKYKTRPLYEKANNPNARLIRAVALRSGRLRPIGFPQGGSCPYSRTDEGCYVPLIRPDLTVSPPSPRGEGFSDTSLTLSMTFCCHSERSLLSFCASVAMLCTPHCHSERSEEPFDYNVQSATSNLSDTSLTLSMTLSVIQNEHSCHSEPLYGVKNLRGLDGGSLH